MERVRARLAITFFAALVFAGTACGAADVTGGAAQRARASMVIVSSHMAEHRDAIGAGVVVAVEPGRIRVVTARHVADHGPVTVWIDGRPLEAEIVRTFMDRDIAVVDAVGVHLDTRHVRPAVAAAAVAPPGSDVYVGGEIESGLRIEPASLVEPAYAAPDRPTGPMLLWIACESCTHGDSGGGIFDAQGRLLGILTGRYFNSDNRTIAIVGEPLAPAAYALTDEPVSLQTLP